MEPALNIPNILTMFRLLLIPVFVVFFYLDVSWNYTAAAFIFWLAAVTDYFDGFLARKLKQSTPFGAFIDPVADKLMVTIALLLLTQSYNSLVITIPAIIIVGREIIISALREWMAELGLRGNVAVSNLGKYKTVAQMLALQGLIWRQDDWIVYSGYLLLYFSAILSLWSMFEYLNAAKSSLFSKQAMKGKA